MKVVAFNGSSSNEGNTAEALKMVLAELDKENIETELIHVGGQQIQGCIACHMCAINRDERCVLQGDDVNLWIQKMKQADGIIFGSPTHFAGMSATMKAFMDRAFYVAGNNGGLFRLKPAAAIAAVRRSGGVPAFDAMNRYIQYSEMFLVGSNYWNVIHGALPGEAGNDEEGAQIMSILGQNMAWLLNVLEDGKKAHLAPERTRKKKMNFIRK